ncbi:MAG: hypothetical protein JW795_18830 [Chitinivibrionales bacterium]|nr:hypothetical protein [Chitinivibrionales bacterium]
MNLENIIIVSIVFGSLLLGLIIVFSFILIVRKNSLAHPTAQKNQSDASLIDELTRQCERLQERVEALETILNDTKKKEPFV